MSIQELGALGEFVSVFLILITLVYLAVQNRQQRKLLLSNVYQARTDSTERLYGMMIEHPEIAESMEKGVSGDQRTPTEILLANSYLSIIFKLTENIQYQHNLGIFPDDHLAASRRAVKSSLQNPGVPDLWGQIRFSYRESFALWMDEIIQEIEQEEAAA